MPRSTYPLSFSPPKVSTTRIWPRVPTTLELPLRPAWMHLENLNVVSRLNLEHPASQPAEPPPRVREHLSRRDILGHVERRFHVQAGQEKSDSVSGATSRAASETESDTKLRSQVLQWCSGTEALYSEAARGLLWQTRFRVECLPTRRQHAGSCIFHWSSVVSARVFLARALIAQPVSGCSLKKRKNSLAGDTIEIRSYMVLVFAL